LNLRKGWYKASNGYIYIWDPEHPNADKRGYVAEHTKVMAEVLGSPLDNLAGATVTDLRGFVLVRKRRCAGTSWVALSFQKRRCIIVTGRETTTGLRTSSCGLEAGSHPELE
jgi:hypothetical protein